MDRAKAEQLVSKMSVKQLKQVIADARLSTADCVEKSDLQNRAIDGLLKTSSGPFKKVQRNINNLSTTVVASCGVIDGEQVPDLVVLILHGYGATSDDFLPVAQVAMASPLLQNKKLAFLLPQAPADSLTGMPQWWPIDVQKWVLATMQRNEDVIAKLIREPIKGLPEANQMILAFVNEARTTLFPAGEVPMSRVCFSGFSQGAMTALDSALSLPESPAGVLVLSGTPLTVDTWAQRCSANHKGLKVMITHGKQDSVLPFMASEWLRDLLVTNGADVTFVPHNQEHTLGPRTVLDKILEFFASL